jgi:hypothetical protein
MEIYCLGIFLKKAKSTNFKTTNSIFRAVAIAMAD